MVSYERREHELSNDVYILNKNNSSLLRNVSKILGFLFTGTPCIYLLIMLHCYNHNYQIIKLTIILI